MKSLKDAFLKVYREQRVLFVMMILTFLFGVFVIIFSIVSINPNSAVVRIGYGDIGGYRDGSWTNLLAFPLLALLFGVFHNFLALRIFEKRGDGVAKVFVVITFLLLVGAFVIFLRLLGES